MDGTIAPIEQICDVAKKYNAMTFLDEVRRILSVAVVVGTDHRRSK